MITFETFLTWIRWKYSVFNDIKTHTRKIWIPKRSKDLTSIISFSCKLEVFYLGMALLFKKNVFLMLLESCRPPNFNWTHFISYALKIKRENNIDINLIGWITCIILYVEITNELQRNFNWMNYMLYNICRNE